MTTKNFKVQGFLRNERVKQKHTDSKGIKHAFEGLKLDEIQLSATITNKKEFDDLMDFLLISETCFYG